MRKWASRDNESEALPMMQVQRLVKTYEDRRAVDSFDLALRTGEIIGLVGPEGSGKSTALSCLAGVTRASAGRISVGGFDIALYPAEARRQMVFVPERPRLSEHLSVWDHMLLQARHSSDPAVFDRAGALLAGFGLEERLGAPARQLDGREKRLLAIAAAMLHRPRLLILDEPFTDLDPQHSDRIRTAVKRLTGEGTAVIFSSRELCPLEGFCQRVVLILDGKTVFDGTLDGVRSSRDELAALPGLATIFPAANK
jgi:ABC-2 type transport system ATP-binding protein